MNHFIDALMVGAVICASVFYASLSLGPRGLRRRFVAAAAHFGLRLGPADIAAKGGCASCDNCGSAATPAAATPVAKDGSVSAPEVRISVGKIGRR